MTLPGSGYQSAAKPSCRHVASFHGKRANLYMPNAQIGHALCLLSSALLAIVGKCCCNTPLEIGTQDTVKKSVPDLRVKTGAKRQDRNILAIASFMWHVLVFTYIKQIQDRITKHVFEILLQLSYEILSHISWDRHQLSSFLLNELQLFFEGMGRKFRTVVEMRERHYWYWAIVPFGCWRFVLSEPHSIQLHCCARGSRLGFGQPSSGTPGWCQLWALEVKWPHPPQHGEGLKKKGSF